MDKIDMMRVFVAAADCQSFVAASQQLDRSAPAVTRSIAQLENTLGVRLFHRTTRRVRLTESGARYYEDAKRVLEDIEEIEAAVAGVYAEPKGVLSLTAPVLFGQKYVVPVLVEYLSKNPAVEVKATFFDRIGNILDEGLDVAIRIGHLKDSSQFATQVGSVQRVVCGSPAYFQKQGIPQSPADLVNHEIILSSTVEPSTTWAFESSAGRVTVKLSPRLYCSQNDAAISAAKSGFGITRVMSYQVAEEIQNGSLIRVLQEYEVEPMPINIVHLEGRRANAKIRSFVDLATERLRGNPLLQ